ncbi:hypothetical protein [Streptomyces sp. NPDC060333]|uniref:ATP-dependent DNA ligase n=1 Tax=Streptomyces sp. NPDC060333 TaxID=3347098 RepID=UPI003660FECB
MVLDGELLVWHPAEGRLSFEALQRRAAALAARTPAYFIVFDLLQADGTELLTLPYRERRRRLERRGNALLLVAPHRLAVSGAGGQASGMPPNGRPNHPFQEDFRPVIRASTG